MSEDNVEIVREGWRVWLLGDMDALGDMWDPEIVWDTTHFHDWPETSYRGPDGVRQFLTEWLETWEDYEIDVEEVLEAPDGRVVSLIRQRGKGRQSGLEMSMVSAQITTLRDGRVVRVDNYENRNEALKAAGLNE